MNKYKFGDKVYISTIDMEGKIIGWEYKVINGKVIDVKYSIEIALEDENVIASNVPEKDLELLEYNECSCDCSLCCGHDTCEDSDYNEDEDDFENELDDDEIEDYRYNKEVESLDNDKKFNLGDLATSPTYPEIKDYYYDEKTATTVIKWFDNTTTKVKASANDTPNQYAGFAFAVAKKYFGNGNKSMKEAHWFIDVCPEMDKELDRAFAEYVQDEERKKVKREAKREKCIIKAKALARKREYEARKLAAEKYGVPMEWNERNA